MKVLHLDSSITGDASISRTLSAAIVGAFKRDVANIVTYRDLAAEPLHHLEATTLGDAPAKAVLAEFLDSDAIVIGAGMYNFSIPSQLKAWIDRILVAGATFGYTAEGVQGLAGDKRVIVALSRGGIYSNGPAAQLEFAENYLRGVFGFIGVSNISFVIAEGVAISEEAKEAAVRDALAQALQVRSGTGLMRPAA